MQNTEGWGSEDMCNRAHPSPCAHIETKQHVDFISIFARASIKLSKHSQLFQARPAISLGATRHFLCPSKKCNRGYGTGERSQVRHGEGSRNPEAADWHTRLAKYARPRMHQGGKDRGEYAPRAAGAACEPFTSKGGAACEASAASSTIRTIQQRDNAPYSPPPDPATV